MPIQKIETDVLVIGGGGAGFRAAIAARERGVRALLVSKGPLARCGASPMAGADFTLDGASMNGLGRDGDTNDSMDKCFNDIVTQGWFLNNQKLVRHYVETAPRLLKDLMDYGIDIKLSDQRMIFFSGLHLMDILLKKARSVGVDLLEDVMVLELLRRDGGVTGALCLGIRTGEFIAVSCRAVVMASGGWHKAFWPNTGMRDLSGEGMAMAQRAGATLGNMEFITFCCNIMYEPPMWRGSLAPYMLGLIAGGRLCNRKGEEFLKQYDPSVVKTGTSTEWNKSFISMASMKEVRAGNGFENGGVHFDRGEVSWDLMKMIATFIFPDWKYKAIDLSEWGRMLEAGEPIEVGPAVEYFDGGIIVNDRFESGVPGLYAAGECCLGAFGSNRVFSAITEMLVQGLTAGENAAAFAGGSAQVAPDASLVNALVHAAEAPLAGKGNISPARARRIIQERAHAQLGPVRNGNELSDFIAFLERVRANELGSLTAASPGRIYNKEWIDALELGNMVQLLEVSARCALARTESRGVHFREDCPVTDNDAWLKESTATIGDGGFDIGSRAATVTSMSPPGGKVPYLDMMKRMMESHSDTGGKH
ncbi:MAG: FAD-binding protein [Spirochaetes bacterium]|nr:MAG: FAD-binding protein [Spirochaetota bacterium]